MKYNFIKKLNKATQKRLFKTLIEFRGDILRSLNQCGFVVKETPNYMIAFIDEQDFKNAINILKKELNKK